MVETAPDDIAGLVERLDHALLYESSGDASALPEDAAAALSALSEDNKRLRAELIASCGYLLNAKIDLEIGTPKRTAIATIEGGLKRARTTLKSTEPSDEV